MKIRMGVLYASLDAEMVYVRCVLSDGKLDVWLIGDDGVHRPHSAMTRAEFVFMIPGGGKAV